MDVNVIIGLPACGKTTFVQKYADKLFDHVILMMYYLMMIWIIMLNVQLKLTNQHYGL
jgi:hypothetical protein